MLRREPVLDQQHRQLGRRREPSAELAVGDRRTGVEAAAMDKEQRSSIGIRVPYPGARNPVDVQRLKAGTRQQRSLRRCGLPAPALVVDRTVVRGAIAAKRRADTFAGFAWHTQPAPPRTRAGPKHNLFRPTSPQQGHRLAGSTAAYQWPESERGTLTGLAGNTISTGGEVGLAHEPLRNAMN